MSPAPVIRRRPGFTLVELLVVIAVIVLLATLMLGIRASNPEGLGSGQRMMADMLRIARVQAMMNRAAMPPPVISGVPWNNPGSTTNRWMPANFRYRLLIKCDPTDPDAHLREMVIAIGVTGICGNSATAYPLYCWFSPEPPVRLPPGVFFVPPNLGATLNAGFAGTGSTVVMPTGTTISGTAMTAAGTWRTSKIPGLADLAPVGATALTNNTWDSYSPAAGSAPMMLYRPIYSPIIGSSVIVYNTTAIHGGTAAQTASAGSKYWYYVELGPDGSNNHTGKVVLVLAEGVNTGKSVLLTSVDKFAGILVRRNGDVSLTTDSADLESTTLFK